jgi:hypothetical protein
MVFSVWWIDFEGILLSGQSKYELSCKDDFTFYNSETNALCATTGVFLQFGAAAGLAWYTFIAIHTYAMIRFHMGSVNHASMEKYFHLIAWPYGILSAFIPLAGGQYPRMTRSSNIAYF